MAALLARRGLARAKAGVVDGIEDFFLAGRVVAAVEDHRHAGADLQRLLIGHFGGRHKVAQPHLGAIDTEFERNAINHPFDDKGRLGIAGAAHRNGRHLVGLRHKHIERIGRHLVRAGHRRRGVIRTVDALRRVGALIVDHATAQAEDFSARVGGNLDVPVLFAFLDGGNEMFAAVLYPFHRSSG